ncbi:MAG: hypothetical protein GVY28_13055 [Alphaproteobacteria bacterium]|jgi:hypothetical protein|nr:hypothetical protein [Alphaproteobacteria bacterium]
MAPAAPHNPLKPSAGLEAIGWIALALGALGLISSPMNLVMSQAEPGSMLNPFPALYEHVVLQTVLAVLTSGLLLAVGLGTLKLRPWVCRLAIAYGLIALLSSGLTAWTVYTAFTGRDLPQNPAMRAGMLGGAAGGAFGMVMSLALAGFVFWWFGRRDVRRQFDDAQAAREGRIAPPLPPTG